MFCGLNIFVKDCTVPTVSRFSAVVVDLFGSLDWCVFAVKPGIFEPLLCFALLLNRRKVESLD